MLHLAEAYLEVVQQECLTRAIRDLPFFRDPVLHDPALAWILMAAHGSADAGSFTLQVDDYLRAHPEPSVRMSGFAAIARTSPFHLLRLFVKQMGVTPRAYQRDLRVNARRGCYSMTNRSAASRERRVPTTGAT